MKEFASGQLAFLGTNFANRDTNHRYNFIKRFDLLKIDMDLNNGEAESPSITFKPAELDHSLLDGTFDAIVLGVRNPSAEYQAGLAALKQIREASCIPVVFATHLELSDNLITTPKHSDVCFVKPEYVGDLHFSASRHSQTESPSIYAALSKMAFRLTAEEVAARTISNKEDNANVWLPNQNTLRIKGIPVPVRPQEGRLINTLASHKWIGNEKIFSHVPTSARTKIIKVISAVIANKIQKKMDAIGAKQDTRVYPVQSLWGFGLRLNPDMDIKICYDNALPEHNGPRPDMLRRSAASGAAPAS